MSRDFRILSTFLSKATLGFVMLVILVGSINYQALAGEEESTSGSDNNATDTGQTGQTPNSNSTFSSDWQTGNSNSTDNNIDEGQSNSTSVTSDAYSSTNQTTTSSDQDQTSSNVTGSNVDSSWNSTETESYQNSTSSEQQGNSTNAQSTNSTYSGNITETESGNSTSYNNSTQTMNENATNTSNANLTNFVALNQTAASLPPPDFDISIDPLTTNIEAGSSTTYTITVSSINGFNADVSLSITSRPIEGMTSSLSSNMTRSPTNASSALFLDVQSDPITQSGKYKLKVTGSSANMTDKSASVTLELIGKNVTLDEIEQFDPVALTPVLIKDMQDNIIDDISSDRMILISTTVINNYNKTQPFIVVVEVRDAIGTTLYLQLQKGVLNPLGEVEVAISWMPEKAGTYQVRTFAIDQLREDPEPLSAPVGKIVEVK